MPVRMRASGGRPFECTDSFIQFACIVYHVFRLPYRQMEGFLRKETVRRLSLSWGVYPFEIPQVRDTDEMVERSIEIALREGFVRKGDRVVVTAGVPLNVPGTTNLLKVEEV